MSVKLSIAIIAYNNYDDIKEAISTIEKYTDSKLSKKIYVVDNGAALCDKDKIKNFRLFIEKYADVYYIDTGTNMGFGKGNNYVLGIIDSEYHAIVNPDILFNEDAFSSIISYMASNSNVGMVIPNIIDENGERQLVYREELTVFDMFIRFFCKGLFKKRLMKHTMQHMNYNEPFRVPFGQGSFLVIRTELFKQLKGFDEKFFMYVEDADLCKRVNQVSSLMYYPGATVIHKWEQGSHKNITLFKYHIQSMWYYFKKWGWKIY